MDAIDTPELDAILETTHAEARPYQQRVVQLVYDNFVKIGVNSQLVNSPTGSGKTVMGLAAARWLQDEYNIGIGWAAMRRNLLSQVAAANHTLGMGVQSLTTISMFDKDPPKTDIDGRPIRMLIVDEAQHDAASSMANLHNIIQPEWVLGLSATPFRTDRLKLCFEKVIRDAGIHQLIQQGYLANYRQYVIPNWNPQAVAERYLAEPERWGKSAFYWLNREQMMECYHRLRIAGVRVKYVTGDQPEKEREDILERFDKTEYGDGNEDGIDAIVNMFILTEGWDCTSLKTVWVRDSQRGPTIQMAGRVFRQYPAYQHKQIIQSKNTRWPMPRTATPAEAYVWTEKPGGEYEWRSVKPSKRAQLVANRALLTLAHTQASMPDFILKKRGRYFGQRGTESGLTRRNDGGWGTGGAFI
jgi:superfamily II DNA or RNA helicase